MLGGFFFIAGMTLLVMSLLTFFIRSKIFIILVSSLCVILFGLYLVYDT